VRLRALGAVFVQRARILSELRRPADDGARGAPGNGGVAARSGAPVGPEPAASATLPAGLEPRTVPDGTRRVRAHRDQFLSTASAPTRDRERADGHIHGDPALRGRPELECAFPHAGARRRVRPIRWGARLPRGTGPQRQGGGARGRHRATARPAPARAARLRARRGGRARSTRRGVTGAGRHHGRVRAGSDRARPACRRAGVAPGRGSRRAMDHIVGAGAGTCRGL